MTPAEEAGIARIQKTLIQRLGTNVPPQTGEAGIVNIQSLLQDLFAAPAPPAQIQQVIIASPGSVSSVGVTSTGRGAAYTPTIVNGALLQWALTTSSTAGTIQLFRSTVGIPALGATIPAGDIRFNPCTVYLSSPAVMRIGSGYDVGPSPNGLTLGQTYYYYLATDGTISFSSATNTGVWITER